MTSYELLILKFLYQNKATSEVICITKTNIKSKIDEKREVSEITFHRKIKSLEQDKYIAEGGRDGKKKRYYITEKGIEILNRDI